MARAGTARPGHGTPRPRCSRRGASPPNRRPLRTRTGPAHDQVVPGLVRLTRPTRQRAGRFSRPAPDYGQPPRARHRSLPVVQRSCDLVRVPSQSADQQRTSSGHARNPRRTAGSRGLVPTARSSADERNRPRRSRHCRDGDGQLAGGRAPKRADARATAAVATVHSTRSPGARGARGRAQRGAEASAGVATGSWRHRRRPRPGCAWASGFDARSRPRACGPSPRPVRRAARWWFALGGEAPPGANPGRRVGRSSAPRGRIRPRRARLRRVRADCSLDSRGLHAAPVCRTAIPAAESAS
jgi:hypothetical protein